ncbi:MAG: hypothetical protein GY720_03335 [bacterium]|nr:hypothetical protein [bacterium]
MAKSFAIHMLPAALVGVLMLGLVGGIVGAVVSFAVVLVAPGWLAWKLLPAGILENDPPALPALWLVLSFTLLSPVLGGAAFLGWPVAIVEIYLLVGLAVLGILAVRVATPTIEPWGRTGTVLAGVAGLAVVFRALTWHNSGDDKSYLGFMNGIIEGGTFPTVNPFLTGDLPLSTRWKLDGWTGITGIISHLGDASPVNVYRDLLPAVLILFAASALFLLARVLSGDVRFGHYAALSGLLVPLITGTKGKTDFKFWYKSIAQNKYAALIVFLPVVAALLIAAYRSRKRSAALVGAAALWAMLFAHPVPAVFAVLVFGVYVIGDLLFNRPPEVRAAVILAGLMVAPLLVTAAGLSLTSERYGTSIGDIEDFAEFVSPAIDVGPIEIWEPLDLTGGVVSADPSMATVVFASGHAWSGNPRVAFLANGIPMAHWRLLDNPANLLVLAAFLVIIIGRHRDPVALWIVAATLVAVSVFLIPPFAAIVARFTTPWQLWRFSWMMPVPLAVAWLLTHRLRRAKPLFPAPVVIGLVLLVFTLLSSTHGLLLRAGPHTNDVRIEAAVADLDGLEGVLLAQSPIQDEANSAHTELIGFSYRGLATTSNNFPSELRSEAFSRFQDARLFFHRTATMSDRLEILDRYDVRYVVVEKKDRDKIQPKDLGLQKVGTVGGESLLYERTAVTP